MSTPKKIIIVGAGICGLTLAHSLKKLTDYDVRVIEKDTPDNLLGTGINLLGNALRALDQVGLAEECLKHGKGWSEVSLADGAGNVHRTIRTGNSHREGFPSALGIMRPIFGKILESNALASGAKIDYKTTVTDIAQNENQVTVTLSNGETDHCDLLVAADGALSETRRMVFGDHFKGKYVGQGIWRYTIPRPETLKGFTAYRHGELSLGLLPLSEEICYLFFIENSKEKIHIPDDKQADMLRERLEGFTAPEIQHAKDIIDDEKYINYRPLEPLLVPQPWYKGRVLLVGDAAHAVTPQLTSGGGMAIEDAVVLAEELQHKSNIDQALQDYCERRKDRVQMVYDNSLAVCRAEQQPTRDEASVAKILGDSYRELYEERF